MAEVYKNGPVEVAFSVYEVLIKSFDHLFTINFFAVIENASPSYLRFIIILSYFEDNYGKLWSALIKEWL
jgi:hypothetical protein